MDLRSQFAAGRRLSNRNRRRVPLGRVQNTETSVSLTPPSAVKTACMISSRIPAATMVSIWKAISAPMTVRSPALRWAFASMSSQTGRPGRKVLTASIRSALRALAFMGGASLAARALRRSSMLVSRPGKFLGSGATKYRAS